MAQTPPDESELARRLVRFEAGDGIDALAAAAGTEKACAKIVAEMRTSLGSRGVFALLGRALDLAKRESPSLAAVTLDHDRPEGLDGLTEALAAESADDAISAGAAILANLFKLLILLLGEDLGLQPVRKFWPHLARRAGETDP